jgi:hypothetical protein
VVDGELLGHLGALLILVGGLLVLGLEGGQQAGHKKVVCGYMVQQGQKKGERVWMVYTQAWVWCPQQVQLGLL